MHFKNNSCQYLSFHCKLLESHSLWVFQHRLSPSLNVPMTDPGFATPHTSKRASSEAITLAAHPVMWLSPINKTLCLQHLEYFALLLSNFTIDSLTKLCMWSSLLFILLIFLLSFLDGLIWPFTLVGIQFVFWSLIDSPCTSWWFGGSCWVVFLGRRVNNGFLILPWIFCTQLFVEIPVTFVILGAKAFSTFKIRYHTFSRYLRKSNFIYTYTKIHVEVGI